MSTAARPDEFPEYLKDDLPHEVRQAFAEWGRATAALRLYKRRGWNTSAVRHQVDRARFRVFRLIDELEHSEENPPLF